MREEDAKKKWCPQVRFHLSLDGTVYDNKPETDDNPDGEAEPGSTYCIASNCMMWVWDEKAGHNYSVKHPQGDYIRECKEDSGHCGLAK